MKNYIILPLMILCINVYSQITWNGLNPGTAPSICPLESHTFEYILPEGCPIGGYSFVKIPETTNDFTLSDNHPYLTLSAKDKPQTIKFKYVSQQSECGSDQTFELPVKSVKGLTPTISGPGTNTYSTGKEHEFLLTSNLTIQHKRPNESSEPDFYEWEISSGGQGWEPIGIGPSGSSAYHKVAEFNTDDCNGATIRVRGGFDGCLFSPSNWVEYQVYRNVEQGCPISGPDKVVCGSTSDLVYSVQKVQNVTGYTYEWSLPNGWTGVSYPPGDVITVTPDGVNAGTVSVVTKSCGMQSSSCNYSVEIVPFDPNTTIVGPGIVCEGEYETYQLSPAPPSGSIVTWEVVSINPSYRILATPSSGTGSIATFAGTSWSGDGELRFTISGCGVTDEVEPLEIDFNDPVIEVNGSSGSSAYGSYYYVCPTSGSHYVNVNLINDSDNCVDLWDDSGTAGSEWWNCNQYNFTLQYNGSNYPPYNTVALDIEASNTSCGADNKQIYFIPSYSACSGGWRLMADPNPANDKVNIKVEYEEDGVKQNVEMEKFELLDFQGNVRIKVKEKKKFLQIKVRDLPQGVYYMKATLGDKIISEPLLIQPR